MASKRNLRVLSFLIPFFIIGAVFGGLIWSATLRDYPHFSPFSKEVVQLALFTFLTSGVAAGLLGLVVNWFRERLQKEQS